MGVVVVEEEAPLGVITITEEASLGVNTGLLNHQQRKDLLTVGGPSQD